MSASLLGGFACASSPQEESTALAEPDPPLPVEVSEEGSPEPVEGSEATPEPAWPAGAATASEPPAAVITGIPVCDEYLALYERCEEHLEPEIMAGDRRFYRSESASLPRSARVWRGAFTYSTSLVSASISAITIATSRK